MSGRSLAYLAGLPVEQVKGVGERLGRELRKAGISSVADLLFHFPMHTLFEILVRFEKTCKDTVKIRGILRGTRK